MKHPISVSTKPAAAHRAGKSDNDIAAMVTRLTGKQVDGSMISKHYGDDASDEHAIPQYR
jgi:hypothetical protein